jgi:hypothetical protein
MYKYASPAAEERTHLTPTGSSGLPWRWRFRPQVHAGRVRHPDGSGSSSGPEPGRRPCPGTPRRSRPPRLPGSPIFLFRYHAERRGRAEENARGPAVMLGSRLVRHDRGHHPEGGVLCRWQLAVDVAGRPGRAGAFLAYGGRRPGLRPLSKSWRRHPRPAMPGGPGNDGSASPSSTGSATRLTWCLSLRRSAA